MLDIPSMISFMEQGKLGMNDRFTMTAFLDMATYIKVVKIADYHAVRDFTELVEMLVNNEMKEIENGNKEECLSEDGTGNV